MESNKEKLLKKTYDDYIKLMLDDFPVDNMDSIVAKDVTGYGTTLDEKVEDINRLIKMINDQREQGKGLDLDFKMTPVHRRLSPDQRTAIFMDEFQVSMVVDGAKNVIPLRLTSVFEFIENAWKLVHIHGSQAVETENDTWHQNVWKRKNEELQKLVDEKTAELEHKHRELEIETALERVRAMAMSMQKPDDLADVCQAISEQLEILNVKNIRNVQLAIINEEKKNYANYQYFTAYSKQVYEEPLYGANPSADGMVRAMQKSANSFFVGNIQGEELREFMEWRKKDDQFPDPLLEESGVVYYYFYSIGKGGLGLTTYKEISAESVAVFKRFHKVFTLAYQRFIDIRQALEQAREAQIEAALERVRSLALGMRKSEEVGNVTDKLFEELNNLTGNIFGCTIAVVDGEKDRMELWRARTKVAVKPFETVAFTELIRIFKKYMPDWFPVFYKALTAKEKGLLTEDISGKRRTQTVNSIAEQYNYSKEEKSKLIKNTPENFTAHFLFFDLGYLALMVREKYSDEDLNVVRRFVDLFGFGYTRFLDLKKAEAQTREAQIEAALERVRSRSMGMQKTSELQEVINTVYKQLTSLEIKMTGGAFIAINDENKEEVNCWGAGGTTTYMERVFIPHYNRPIYTDLINEISKGPGLYTDKYSNREKQDFFKRLFKHPPYSEAPSERKKEIMSRQGGYTRSCIVSENTSMFIINHHGRMFSDKENNMLARFGNVFEQTYTRFLDLQKAESQALEAKIETALEKVRSRSMGMQKSEELADLSLELVRQVQALGVETWFCAFNIYDDHPDGSMEWGSNGQGTFPKYRTPREGVFLRYYEAGQKGEKLLINEIGENECPAHYEYLCSLPGVGEQLLKMKDAGIPFPTSQIDHVAYFKFGYIIFITFEPVPEAHEIFIRFAHVFEQTYTRFLDLQKAELQAREAQIEASLEKVRSVALSLQRSHEMLQVAQVLYEQLLELGFTNIRNALIDIKNGNTDTFTDYDYSHEMSGTITQMSYHDDPTLEGQFKMMANTTDDFFELILEGKELEDLIKMRITNGEAPDPRLDKIDLLTYNLYSFGNGAIGISNFGILTELEKSVLARFSNVFTFAYKRYTDMVQAEQQAREALVELSLERIRAQVTAMQESSDLFDIVVSMRKEFISLGHEADYFWHMQWQPDAYKMWMTSDDGSRIGMVITIPKYVHENIPDLAKWENGNDPVYVLPLDADGAWDYIDNMNKHGHYEKVDPNAPSREDIRQLGGLTFIMARTTHGEIGFGLPGYVAEPPKESLDTLERFASVFDLAYRRFEDLKSAEQQNRETQIELSLERIRAKTMAMQNSEELGQTVQVLFDELKQLGLDDLNLCGIGIFQEKHRMEAWTASQKKGSDSGLVIGNIDMKQHPMLDQVYKSWEAGEGSTHYVLEGQDKIKYFENINNQQGYKAGRDISKLPEHTFANAFYFNEGCLYAFTFDDISKEKADIYKRFASVFGQTYRRYLDLQIAEARTLEAIKQSSLDRIRGQIASMRNTDDLRQITPLIWNELTALDVPFFRCGVFIVDEKKKHVQVYLTTPEGKSLAALDLDFDQSDLTRNTVASWRKKEVYQQHWNKDEFIAWAQEMMKLRQIKKPEKYQGGENPPESLHLHFIPFAQGMLYVGHEEQLEQDKIDLVKSLAEAFSFAYARYEDFVVLEEAKNQPKLNDTVSYDVPMLRWKLADEQGAPLLNATVTAKLIRPVQDGHDFDISLVHKGNGIYEAPLNLPYKGL
ncbi:MAG TPA: FixH family protein, partial [Bacteroidales bacterium]|nr:FixH family protein [Bacteroidales bacterium]